MPIIPITQVQVGDRLGSDVQTALGSVLLQQGRALSERDMEILHAFLIGSLDIVRQGLEDQSQDAAADGCGVVDLLQAGRHALPFVVPKIGMP